MIQDDDFDFECVGVPHPSTPYCRHNCGYYFDNDGTVEFVKDYFASLFADFVETWRKNENM